MLAFLEARMSSIISSAVLLSCQRPAKLFVHPLSSEGSATELATELLNRVMSSSFTLLLRSFNSDQYFALTDEVGDNDIVFIMISLLFRCKNRNIIWDYKTKQRKTYDIWTNYAKKIHENFVYSIKMCIFAETNLKGMSFKSFVCTLKIVIEKIGQSSLYITLSILR